MSSFFYKPTEDPIFKYLMSDEVVRNGFLSAVIGETIIRSELLDTALNPLTAYRSLRSLVCDPNVEKLMEVLSVQYPENSNSLPESDAVYQECFRFVQKLSPLYGELTQALPTAERNTHVDMVCETEMGLITAEVQVIPQDFWDLRILYHVCGLFYRQFYKGFKWSEVKTDEHIHKKIKKAIGISLLVKPPQNPQLVQEHLPWYNASPWEEKDLLRHFKLRDMQQGDKIRPGIEFFDVNLSAFRILLAEKNLPHLSQDLTEWLEFFSICSGPSPIEVEHKHSPSVKKAYSMIEDVPSKVHDQFKEYIGRQVNISHFLMAEKEASWTEGETAGLAKGRAEGETAGLAKGRADVFQKLILTLKQKGKTPIQIADLLDLDLDFIHDVFHE